MKTGSSGTKAGRSPPACTGTLLDDLISVSSSSSTSNPNGGIGPSALRMGLNPLSKTTVLGSNPAGRYWCLLNGAEVPGLY